MTPLGFPVVFDDPNLVSCAGMAPVVALAGLVAPGAYLVAGTHEPFFLANATRWADAFGAAGADVVMMQRVGSHGDPFWREWFPLMVAWAFEC